jgi:CheY-like chemotaxis protein
MMDTRQVKILLIEDDDIDATTIERGLMNANILNPLVRAHDGIEAMELLLGTNNRSALDPPYLLLVDIRMPRLDGLGLIRRIRSNPMLHRTIIFVLTTSDSDRDRTAAYDAHVAGYIVKSNAPDQFHALAKMLEYYVLIVTPPPVQLCG